MEELSNRIEVPFRNIKTLNNLNLIDLISFTQPSPLILKDKIINSSGLCRVCVAAEAFRREYTSGADPQCLIQPHVAALFTPKMLFAEKLPGWLVWRWGVLRDLFVTPRCCFSYKTQGQGTQLSLTGTCTSSKDLVRLQGPSEPNGKDQQGIHLPLSILLSA